ncbi:MAG: SusD/RagB family nutrient-binding outer membrane lipoprotein [Bacteroidales bacterium]|nr:SusD/RagB family nutrient-binding outer membrane lipoprotein [Candidatus Cacconaster caballi]
MKNIFKALFTAAAVLLLMSSCTGKFEEMNISPNSPSSSTADPKMEFQYALSRSICYRNTYQSDELIMFTEFCEYDANTTQARADYDITDADTGDMWSRGYSTLKELNNIIRISGEDPLYANLIQMAKIWRCWVMLRTTDIYGDIPYSEAASDDAHLPKYDTQKEVYYLMFTELKDAADALDASKANTVGDYDLIYQGDAAKWKKFANSLRLRMACRIADVDPSKAATEAAAAISAGVMTSNADGAYMTMGAESNSDYTWNPIYYGRTSTHSACHMSLAYERLVTNLGGVAWPTAADQAANKQITDASVNAVSHPEKVDPRSPIHFQPAGTLSISDPAFNGFWRGSEPGHSSNKCLSGELIGLPAGVVDNCQNYANMSLYYRSNPEIPWTIMKYSEVCLLKAIAGARNLASVDAKSAYEEGIRADMEFYGVPAATINAYLNSTDKNYYGTSVAYNDNSGSCNTALDKIITQKYIAGFFEGAFEAWSDHRQYHKPTLIPFANICANFIRSQADYDNNTSDAYLLRLYYPSSEYNTNEENVREAVARLGADTYQKRVWWDVD